MADLATPILIAAVALPLIGQVYLAMTTTPNDGGAVSAAERVLQHVAAAAPSVLMVLAMFALRRVLVEYEAGRLLSSAASDSFKRVGYWALCAVLVKVLAPSLVGLVMRGDGSGLLSVDVFDGSLLMFSALVVLVGGAFATAAAAIKADHDEIV